VSAAVSQQWRPGRRYRASVSYDLTFVPRLPAQPWDEALEAAEEVGAATADPAAWTAILAAARLLLGDVDVERDDDSFELVHEPTGIQASYDGAAAAISVPYRYTGPDARAVVAQIYALGRAVEDATGLSGYDHQLDGALAEVADDPTPAVGVFDSVAATLAGR
jgi:hypothetical protein